jgi:hypothetical protein
MAKGKYHDKKKIPVVLDMTSYIPVDPNVSDEPAVSPDYLENGARSFLRNDDKYLPDCTILKSGRE